MSAAPVAVLPAFEETGVAVPENVGTPAAPLAPPDAAPAAAGDEMAAAAVGLSSGGAICRVAGIDAGTEFAGVGETVMVLVEVNLTVEVPV